MRISCKNKKHLYKCALLDSPLRWLKEMNIFYGINHYYIRKVLPSTTRERKWHRYYGTLFIFLNNCGSFRVFQSIISYQYISWGTQLHVTSFACFQVFQTHAMGPRQIIIYFKFFYIADVIRKCLVLLYSKQGRHHITQCFHLVGRSWFSLKKRLAFVSMYKC